MHYLIFPIAGNEALAVRAGFDFGVHYCFQYFGNLNIRGVSGIHVEEVVVFALDRYLILVDFRVFCSIRN